MKSPVRIILKLLLIITLTYISQEIYAGTSPPDPGGSPTGGGPPVGGGAPIGNGTIFLIVAALTYALYKVRSLWETKEVRNN
jgi:hypothetical protein